MPSEPHNHKDTVPPLPHGGTAPPLGKKHTKRQSHQRQGRGARSAPALHEACGQKPTPRWAFPHARPHESIVSVFVTTSEPSEKVPCCEVVVRFPIQIGRAHV